MKDRALAAILLGVAVLQSMAPGIFGFSVPQDQSALAIPKNAAIFAWSIISIYSIVMATYLLLRRVNYGAIIFPLIATYVAAILILISDAQGWWWISFVLTGAMLAPLWRTFYILTKHRVQVTLLGQVLVTTPVAIYAGWTTVAMISRLADAMWNSGIPHTGTLATAWQSILVIIAVLAAGFGIEASRAHPAFAAAVVWACIHMVLTAAKNEQGVLTGVSLFATLIVLALFFIERAMFRGPRAQRASH